MSIRTAPAVTPRKRRHTARREPQIVTLGDLVVALTEETRRYVSDEEEVYRLVAYMVTDILARSEKRKAAKHWH
ncbi:MAG TPA: hypothetical protein VGH50_17420 [Candidatus Binatia bacterium]